MAVTAAPDEGVHRRSQGIGTRDDARLSGVQIHFVDHQLRRTRIERRARVLLLLLLFTAVLGGFTAVQDIAR